MSEDALSKAKRYRKAANKYGEMAKQAEPGHLAEVFRKIAARYAFMAEDVLRGRAERLGARMISLQTHLGRPVSSLPARQ